METHNVLKRKKFVLLLDDIWEKLNLNVIGVPYPNRENGCKVAFTTHSRDVCGRMGANDTIEVSCLDTDTAWALFKKKVGENTLESHPDILELARKVAGKCRGLPLALNVIGETMASKRTVEEWRGALHVLTSSAAEFSGMEDEILPILKYSYDSLNSEQLKSCLLYCSLFMEDYPFEKERLIEYWIGEGFIDEKEGSERVLDRGYEILGTLVRACLLEGEDNSSVARMHDVVREMALWIDSDLGKHKERCFVQAGFNLLEVTKVKNWKNVRRMSLMAIKIEKISESIDCPKLTTLLLGVNSRLVTISGEFFQSMPRLLVLDLSYSTSFSELPEQLSSLVSLRHLDLLGRKIKRLPVGVQKLKMLIYLTLEWTSELEHLQGLSKLSSLRTLKQGESKLLLDMSHMEELHLLEHLEFISITVSSSLVKELLLYDPKMRRCIQEVCIRERPEESVSVLTLPAVDNLRDMDIQNCGMEEIHIEKTTLNKSLLNLSDVRIDWCDGLKDLTWLLFAPNLTCLRVLNSNQLEDVIIKEKSCHFFRGERGETQYCSFSETSNTFFGEFTSAEDHLFECSALSTFGFELRTQLSKAEKASTGF